MGTVWFFDHYDNFRSGKIIKITKVKNETYYFIENETFHTTYYVSPKDCYFTADDCLNAHKKKYDDTVNEYIRNIKTIEDLVLFMFTHTVSYAEEYTDYAAREAAIKKATEFGITLED